MSARKEAAALLAILASQPESWPWFIDDCPWPCSDKARKLAERAWDAAADCAPVEPWRAIYAEAECLLRTGWSP